MTIFVTYGFYTSSVGFADTSPKGEAKSEINNTKEIKK